MSLGLCARRLTGPIAILFSLSAPTPSVAVTPAIWTVENYEQFETGHPDGVAVVAEGGLVLAPALNHLKIAPFDHTPEPFIWSQAVDSKGTLYLGGGTGGRIYRVRPGSIGNLYYEAGELAVHALAIGRSDTLFAATSPQGRVLRITGEAKGETWFQPDDRYIWALVVDREDDLFAATGERGIIYRISSKGKGEVYYDSEEMHIVSLTLDQSGHLLAGSDGRGLLYRITGPGEATVLHDSPLREVSAIAVAPDGVIYAAAVGRKPGTAAQPVGQRRPPGAEGSTVTPESTPSQLPIPGIGPAVTAVVTVTASGDAPVEQTKTGASRSEIYRIDTDGTVTTVWSSPSETVYTMTIDPAGRLVFGSGDPGRIRMLDGGARAGLLARIPESQVTSLVNGSGGLLYVASSNGGRVYALDENSGDSGTFVSPTRDAGALARWGRISWRAEAPGGTRVEMATRTGNSSTPDATWSSWSPAHPDPAGSPVNSPAARFLQWRARLTRGSGSAGPILQAVSTSYVQANIAPLIRSVTVEPPGIVREQLFYLNTPDPEELAFAGIRVNPEGVPSALHPPGVPDKKVYVRGMRSVTWEAEDPNGDLLDFDISFRSEEGSLWLPLGRGLRRTYFAFDSMQLPDDRYRVRIEASDKPSNDAATARNAVRESSPFIIDNTSPVVSVAAGKPEKGSGARIEVTATDGIGPIARAEYSIDARRFVPLSPLDGISDSREESYAVTLEGLSGGEHTVIVKVTDLLGNVGAGKAKFSTK